MPQLTTLPLGLLAASLLGLSLQPGTPPPPPAPPLASPTADELGITYVPNAGGPTLGYSAKSGVKTVRLRENALRLPRIS